MYKLLTLSAFLVFVSFGSCFAQTLSRGVQIERVAIFDEGSTSFDETPLGIVDVSRGDCGSTNDPDPEPFNNTVLGLKLSNTNLSSRRVRRLVARIRLSDRRVTVRSRIVQLVPSESSTEVFMVLAIPDQAGGKVLVGDSRALSNSEGARNARVRLRGQGFRLRARYSMIFANPNRCEG